MNPIHLLRRTRCFATLGVVLLAAQPIHADAISDWNGAAEAITADKKLPGPVYGRTLALMHVAQFEAVNAIERRYVPYRLNLIADRNTSGEAAAAAAAHFVLLSCHPDHKADLDAFLARQLTQVSAGDARERGLILGHRAAADLLELRAHDGSEILESWRPVTQPGVYIPTSVAISSTVAGYAPWVMKEAAQFRPGPPPALTSATWTRDLNEIRAVGGLDSNMRTAEQTSTAKFWFLTGARTYSSIVEQIARHRRLDLLDSARLHALVAMAGMDAYIAVFDAKYTYNFWRPITALRNADLTGNAATPRAASWLPLGETPMHPEYPCAHCIVSAAVAAVLQAEAGADIGEITLTSATAPGVTRRWTRLADYSAEVSNARVWAGFHYRFSARVGAEMGEKIGALTVATQLAPEKRGQTPFPSKRGQTSTD